MAKIKIDKALYSRAKEIFPVAGYTSVEEFVEHAIETAIEKFCDSSEDEAVIERLKGLGYIE